MATDWAELEHPAELQDLRLTWDESGPGFKLQLTLRRADGTSVHASFSNVTQLRVEQDLANLPVALKVYDHRLEGWESHSQLNVSDVEQDRRLGFYCSSITID